MSGIEITSEIERLRQKLLDLTLRNTLLNVRPTRRTLHVVDKPPNSIYRSLVDDQRAMKFDSLPDEKGLFLAGANGDGQTATPDNSTDMSLELPADAEGTDGDVQSGADRLPTRLFADALETRLKKIQREAKSTIDEIGVNYLHFAFGVLSWRENDNAVDGRCAPLILVPVSIERVLDEDHGKYRYLVSWNGDEIASNVCLLKKLEADFGVRLPEFTDEMCPEEYWELVTGAVADRPGWKIKRQAFVGFFAFHKLSMYLDVDPRNWQGHPAIGEDSIASQLICGGATNTENGIYAPDYEIDQHPGASDLPLALNADSSQHSALCDIAEGKNLVIEGPPGTGKSQTIANAIANAIASGKTVLFVAEKLAALEVVFSRLRQVGVGDFCLQLHSHAAAPKNVVDSVRKRLQLSVQPPHKIDEIRRGLRRQADEISKYLAETSKHVGPYGEPLRDLFWRVVHLRSEGRRSVRRASFDASVQRDEYEGALQALRSAENALGEIPNPTQAAWWGFFPERLNPNDTEPVLEIVARMRDCLSEVSKHFHSLTSQVGGTDADWARDALRLDVSTLSGLANGGPVLRQPLFCALADPEVRREAASLYERVILLRTTSANFRRDLIEDFAGVGRRAGAVQAAAVSGALSRIPDDVTVRNLQQYQLWLLSTQSAISRLVGTAEILESAGFGPARSVADMQGALLRLRLASHEVVRDAGALTEELFYESSKDILRVAYGRWSDLKRREKSLGESLDLGKCPPATEVQALADTLRPYLRRRFRKLHREYRTTMRSVEQFAAGERKHRLADTVKVLDSLAAFDCDANGYNADRQLQNALGIHFKGMSTCWSTLGMLNKWVLKAKSCGLGYSAASKLAESVKTLPEAVTVEVLRQSIKTLADQCRQPRPLVYFVDPLDLPRIGLRDLLGRAKLLADAIATLIDLARALSLPGETPVAALMQTTTNILRTIALEGEIADRARWQRLPDHLHAEACRSPQDVARSLDWVERLYRIGICEDATRTCLTGDGPTICAGIAAGINSLRRVIEKWESERTKLAAFGQLDDSFLQLQADCSIDTTVSERVRSLQSVARSLPSWIALCRTLSRCRRAGVYDFVRLAMDGELPTDMIADAYEFTLLERVAENELSSSGLGNDFSRQALESVRESFKSLDRQLVECNRSEIASRAGLRRPPVGVGKGRVSELTELSLIRHEIEKQKRFCSTRDLVNRAGRALLALKPCFLMSPLSVSRCIPRGSIEFDLVIMDEASQIKPEDAIGTVLRARQLVVVGDPKQLPPTSFFDRPDEELEDEEATQFDNTESILEVAMKSFQPYRRLRWHYRSRHESLIQFSNNRFYDEDLVIFPAPSKAQGKYGVFHKFIENASFSGGMNHAEATAVVARIVEYAKEFPAESLGVAAFNRQQADLIQELLDKACEVDPVAREAIEKLRTMDEPLFVKNLENVQGDERDIIFISYTYGPDAQSRRVMQRFGPINSAVGWRRLNVLVTRARTRMEVFSSLLPSDIHGGPEKNKGVNAYRDFLEYAISGNLPDRGTFSDRAPDSPFEESVARIVVALGLDAVPQVGVAGYFIDIGVRDRETGDFILGIECDGATYHSSKSARDRDRLREEVICSRGWRLHRIWSTDWFLYQSHEEDRLRDAILAARLTELQNADMNCRNGDMANTERQSAT